MRITCNDFYRSVELLESKLYGLKLTTNVWHRHFACHVLHGTSACGQLIASGSTAREAYHEVHAAIRAIEVFSDIENLKAKQLTDQ